MVEAARKYGRIVQAGTVYRSGAFFQKAKEIVQSGALGEVVLCQVWRVGLARKRRLGNLPGSLPPPGLDWDLWLGPASHSPLHENPRGISSKRRPARVGSCGAMAVRGVHLLDVVHYAFDEVMPWRITALGDYSSEENSLETPEAMLAILRYPGFSAVYEGSVRNSAPLFDRRHGTSFFGTEATLVVDREGYCILPTRKSAAPVVQFIDKKNAPLECAARAQLARLHPLAPSPRRRNRDLRPQHHPLPPGGDLYAPRPRPQLGRAGQDRRRARGTSIPERPLPRTLETGSLRCTPRGATPEISVTLVPRAALVAEVSPPPNA